MTEPTPTSPVKAEFKPLSAFAIIFIVMSHCHGGGVNLLTEIMPFYSFHLTLFTFISGYFYRQSANCALAEYLTKKPKN